MFDVTSNQVIKIHKGDDSSQFTLFVNQGTESEPIRYKFLPWLSIYNSPEDLEIEFDTDLFYKKVYKKDGLYDFEYNYLYDKKGERIGELGWYLNQELVELSDYGIVITDGKPAIFDHITIALCKEHASEVYIYILDLYSDLDQWIVKKTFSTNGEVFTEFADCRIGTLDDVRENINEDGDMVLTFDAEDTAYLRAGEYCYQIRAKLYDIVKDKYTINTITNRLPFYVVDGEDSVVW